MFVFRKFGVFCFEITPFALLPTKTEKFSKTGQSKKASIFAYFWLLWTKFNFSKEDWALVFVSIQIWDFSNIS